MVPVSLNQTDRLALFKKEPPHLKLSEGVPRLVVCADARGIAHGLADVLAHRHDLEKHAERV